MASTIQIKRGTGSAVPTGLADGELAINLDNGKLYFGSGSTSVNSFRFTNLTADNYIVSSSVTSYTFQTLSGSSDFGDDVADIHKRTGSLNVSGSVTVDGTLTATDVIINDDLTLTDDVNINATGRIYLDGAGGTQYITSPTTGILELEASSKVYVDTNLQVTSNITASGNISSSGEIEANTFKASGNIQIGNDAEITSIGNMTFRIDSNNDETSQLFTWKDNANDEIASLSENGDFILYGSALGDPRIRLQQETNSSNIGPPIFEFYRNASNTDNNPLGIVSFIGRDSGGGEHTYSRIIGTQEETGAGTEGGKLAFQVASHDGEIVDGLIIEDGNAEDEVDVTIANGTDSLTTIAGNLTVNGVITSSFVKSAFLGQEYQEGEAVVEIRSNNNILFNIDYDADGSGNNFLFQHHTGMGNFTELLKINEDSVDVGASGNGKDLVVFGNANGEFLKFNSSTNNLSLPGEITASGTISSSGTVTADRFIGSQLTMVPWNYYVASNHSSELYIPQGGSQVEVNSDQPYNFMLAPYDGKVRRLSVYYQTGDPGTLTARVRAAAAPFDLDDADDIVQELTQTSVVDDTAYFFDFSASFSKGEAVAVTLEAASHASTSYVVGCIAVEYDTTT